MPVRLAMKGFHYTVMESIRGGRKRENIRVEKSQISHWKTQKILKKKLKKREARDTSAHNWHFPKFITTAGAEFKMKEMVNAGKE